MHDGTGHKNFTQMKRISLFIFLFVSANFVNAQVDGKAIGLRFSGLFSNNAEITYQHPLSASNRIEADLGLNQNVFALTGVYQWVWDLSALADGFNWYVGAGGLLGVENTKFGLAVVGQAGIEYNFDFPLQLSLDYRPAVFVVSGINNHFLNICLSARYKF